jgi:hypothetical protein
MSGGNPLRVVCCDFGFTLWNEKRGCTGWAEVAEDAAFEFFIDLGKCD